MEIFDIHHHLGSLIGRKPAGRRGLAGPGLCQPCPDHGGERRDDVGDHGGDGLYSGGRHQGHDAFQRYRSPPIGNEIPSASLWPAGS